jgi:hypothetical protein
MGRLLPVLARCRFPRLHEQVAADARDEVDDDGDAKPDEADRTQRA